MKKIELTPKTTYNPYFAVLYVTSIILGLFILPWGDLLIAYLLFAFMLSFGIGFGTHRLYIHRCVDVPKWVKRVVVYVSAICNTGSIMTWGMSHYLHHTKTDTIDDPHTPVFYGTRVLFGYYATDEIMKSGNKVFSAVKHIAKDKFASHVHRKYYLYVYSWPLLMLVLFGLDGMLAYGLIPTGLSYISLHLLNYFSHVNLFGSYRNHETSDESRNVWWLLPFNFGENWHNNHHNKPGARNLKEKWWEIDPTYFWVWLFDINNHSRWKIKCAVLKARFKRKSKDEDDFIY